jgi:hypothetical protein
MLFSSSPPAQLAVTTCTDEGKVMLDWVSGATVLLSDPDEESPPPLKRHPDKDSSTAIHAVVAMTFFNIE